MDQEDRQHESRRGELRVINIVSCQPDETFHEIVGDSNKDGNQLTLVRMVNYSATGVVGYDYSQCIMPKIQQKPFYSHYTDEPISARTACS